MVDEHAFACQIRYIQAAITHLLADMPLSTSLGEYRGEVASHVGLDPEALNSRADLVNELQRALRK